jgi:hypothetical protein
MLEARVAPERHVQETEQGKHPHAAFHQTSAEIAETEHRAIVAGAC